AAPLRHPPRQIQLLMMVRVPGRPASPVVRRAVSPEVEREDERASAMESFRTARPIPTSTRRPRSRGVKQEWRAKKPWRKGIKRYPRWRFTRICETPPDSASIASNLSGRANRMSAVASTRYGKVEGEEQPGLSVFKGIPFAAPPAGPLRWLP